MFPSIDLNKQIKQSSKPTTSKYLTSPNGTYIPKVAVQKPQTAAIGGTGQFGSMLPMSTPASSAVAINPLLPQTLLPQSTTNSFLSAGGTQALGVTQPPKKPGTVYTSYGPSVKPKIGVPGQKLVHGDPTMQKIYQNVQDTNFDLDRFKANYDVTGEANFDLLPSEMSTQTIRLSGLTPDNLNALGYEYDPKSNKWYNTQRTNPTIPGSKVNPGDLKYGQYIDSSGELAYGTTKFGRNAQGQRLDIEGNVWNPEDAKRDIYGGEFRQAGETRWVKNRKGRTVRQVLTKDGWKLVKSRKRGGGGGGGNSGGSQTPQSQQGGSYGISQNFNTATG